MPVIRLAAALVLLLASGGMLFAQTAQPAVSTPDFYADAPEADRASIAKAEEFAAQGKWLSAWKTLAEFDAANANPFILAEKVRIALDGYAQNTLHLVFGFVDLAEGQDLESARYGEIEIIGDPIEFNPGEIAKAIEDKGEAIPPVLSMMLGDFYHTVWANYQGQWLQEDAEILAQGAENYERAMAYDTYTPASLDRHSEILMTLQRFDAAESVLAKGLELDPENHVLILRMADIYFSSGRFAEVYPLADKIIAAPTDEEELNDAYVTAIKAGLSALDKENLEKYISGFEKEFPTEYMPGLVRHLVAVQLGEADAADAAADAVTATFPGNPDVIRSVLSTWLSANDPESGFRYLSRAIEKAPADDVMAALYFYKALLSGEISQSAEGLTAALGDLAKAEEYFVKSYPEGHEIFGMISDLKAQWNDAIKASQAPADAAPAQESDATSAASEEYEESDTPAVETPAAETPATTAPETAAPVIEAPAPAAPAPATAAPAAETPAQPADSTGWTGEADATSGATE